MGLSKLKVHGLLYFAPSRRYGSDNVSKTKIRVKDEKVYVKKRNTPRHGLGGSYHEKRRNESTNRAEPITGDNLLSRHIYILSLYPKNFGYSLGGYSHRERWPRTR
jgi:hypothetical protein